MANNRALICKSCLVRTGNICDKIKGGCGCALPAKQRSITSKCPLNKW